MEIPKHIKDGVKNSIGYVEAENIKSFMAGASVAFSRAEEHFSETYKIITFQRDQWEKAYKELHKDMLTLVSIINKYTPEH